MIYNNYYNSDGYWSPITSSIDWCEENYIVSKYIAEFWNTLSNSIYILYALVGMRNVKKYHYDQRFYWAYFGLLCIGFGSWLFHMTLRYQMELADELPMIYTCCIAVFCIFEILDSKTYRPYITIILWLTVILFTIMYTEIISWPWFQHGSTALLIGVIVFRSLHIINHILKIKKLYDKCDEKQLTNKSSELKSWISLSHHLTLLKFLLFICSITYILAFLLWNIDNIYCNHLLYLRNKYRYLSFLFQFHAWWHILTGIGTYCFFIFNLYIRSFLMGYHSTHIKWLLHLIPYIAHNNNYEKEKRNIS
ncbi:alkaline phytoceramidase [Anaeromyces robustus]|uniref:Alkaline phytoceramidase n=1 Tax=Anaeromyces robustus TaxID=1754192 RepID=A0A1Y1XB13_9FUNG|nr:alkaline phytoceramidase [Anaeromyces robustus]|eukprot:ORX82940.1 alkaline phytoceramidase [Anaeromyces robustus]